MTTEPDNSLYNKIHTEAYNKQRKDRLEAVLFDYLSDDDSTDYLFCDDLKSLLSKEIQWANEQLQKRVDLATQLGL